MLIRLISASIVILIFSSLNVSFSQDINFSQFSNSPLLLNPALTGNHLGNHRFQVNRRTVTSSILRGDSYNINSISYDSNIDLKNSGKIGIGITFTKDAAGELSFGNQEHKLLSSYTKRIGKDSSRFHFIGIGIDLGFTNRRIDWSGTRIYSQFENDQGPTVFDPLPITESQVPSYSHFDLAMGLLWKTILNQNNSFQFGFAMHHVNRTTFNHFRNEKLNIRYTLHGSADLKLSNRFAVAPSFRYLKQSNFEELLLGSLLSLAVKSKINAIEFGIWYRNNSYGFNDFHSGGFTYLVSAVLNKFSLSISYDTFSYPLRAAGSSNHGYELSLGYVIGRGW